MDQRENSIRGGSEERLGNRKNFKQKNNINKCTKRFCGNLCGVIKHVLFN